MNTFAETIWQIVTTLVESTFMFFFVNKKISKNRRIALTVLVSALVIILQIIIPQSDYKMILVFGSAYALGSMVFEMMIPLPQFLTPLAISGIIGFCSFIVFSDVPIFRYVSNCVTLGFLIVRYQTGDSIHVEINMAEISKKMFLVIILWIIIALIVTVNKLG